MTSFNEIECDFVSEFAKLYSKADEQISYYFGPDDIEEADKPWFWRLESMDTIYEMYYIGFSAEILSFSHYVPIKTKYYYSRTCDPLHEPVDGKDHIPTYEETVKMFKLASSENTLNEGSLVSRAHDIVSKKFENVHNVNYFIESVFSEICRLYTVINDEVERVLQSEDKSIDEIISSGWFTFEEDQTKIVEMINDMITNCFRDPETHFHYYKNNEKYIVFKRNKNNMDLPDINELNRIEYSYLPCIETSIELFWKNALSVNNRNIIVPENATHFEKYIITATTYDKYNDTMTTLVENIYKVLGAIERDHRFKNALDDLSKSHISCEGCRENQPNQLAHMGSGGCLNDDFE